MDSLLKSENQLIKNNDLINNNIYYNEFEIIMAIYQKALDITMQRCIDLKAALNEQYKYDVITNVTGRIKTPHSISGKMKKKKIDISYQSMIENINDIAGIRIVCNYKDDIYKIRNIIRKQNDIKILKEKDYIKKAKKSGYSAYHMILKVPVPIGEKELNIKVEIQIRTMLMDFWSSTEHKIKYKPNGKISKFDSMRLRMYAKILNMISDKMMKICKRQKSELSYSKNLLQ